MRRQRVVADFAVAGRTGPHIRCGGPEGEAVIDLREVLDTENHVDEAQRASLLAVTDLSIGAQLPWRERVVVVKLMNGKARNLPRSPAFMPHLGGEEPAHPRVANSAHR